CCVVFTIALATPASWLPTPDRAVLESGTNVRPMPTLIAMNDGRMCVQYDECRSSWVSHTIAPVASTLPVDMSTRGPTRGSNCAAIPAPITMPPENGRYATPLRSAL